MDMREDMRPLAVAVIKVLQNISESVVNTPLDKYLLRCFAAACALCKSMFRKRGARPLASDQRERLPQFRAGARTGSRAVAAAERRQGQATNGSGLFSSARERELPVRQGPPSRPAVRTQARRQRLSDRTRRSRRYARSRRNRRDRLSHRELVRNRETK